MGKAMKKGKKEYPFPSITLRVNSEAYVAFNISYLVKSESGAKYDPAHRWRG